MEANAHWSRVGRLLALLAFLASLVAGGYLATAQSWGSSSGESISVYAGTTVVTSWTNRPERDQHNERVMQFWGGVLVTLSLASLLAAWRGLTPLVWLGAGLLAVLTILGLASIGILIAPVALLLLAAAVCLRAGGVTSQH